MMNARYRKSSYSGGPNGNCVEVAQVESSFAVRDSKDADGPVLTGFSVSDWNAFLASLKTA